MQNEISVKIYSTFNNVPQPDEIQISENSKCKSLIKMYLSKNKLYFIDPNLIKVKIAEINKQSRRLRHTAKNNIMLNPSDLFVNENHEYYLFLEEGTLIHVNINMESKVIYNRHVKISPDTTVAQLFDLMCNIYPVMRSQDNYNLSHNSGKLKPIDFPAMVVQKTGSNEFQMELNQDEESVIKRTLRKWRTDNISPLNEQSNRKHENNLIKTFNYNSQIRVHRRLPEISKSSVGDKSNQYVNKHSPYFLNEEIFEEDKIERTEPKRSLPRVPRLQMKTDFRRERNTNLGNNNLEDHNLPPSPIIKTNTLIDEINTPSPSQTSDISCLEIDVDDGFKKTVLRNSVILRNSLNDFHLCSPNLYQLVKYCNLIHIDLTIKTDPSHAFPIELNEELFQSVISPANKRPSGPVPLIGCEKSAFMPVENGKEERKYFVFVVSNVHPVNVKVSVNSLRIGDVLVYIDGESVLSKSKEYVLSKFTENVKHEIIIARYKHLTPKDREKDETIKELKHDLDNLKQKYFALHNVTTVNNQIIQQLNKQLKFQQFASHSVIP